jgi:alcohol dehydrogenase class IV
VCSRFAGGAAARTHHARHARANALILPTIIDSFGASTIRQDLAAFNTAFGLPHLCG